MFNYIKWELVNETKNKKIVLFTIVAIYLAVALLPYNDNIITDFIYLAFSLIIMGSLVLGFLYGAKRTIDSYKNQTFLLESMISLSPGKILFAKYILAIIFNFVCSLIFIFGIFIAFNKSNINVDLIFKFFMNIDLKDKLELLKLFTSIFASTITFTAVVTFVYIAIRSFLPNIKIIKFLVYMASLFVLEILYQIIYDICNNSFMVYSILMLVVSFICYIGTVWFIENKLEVYK